MKDAKKFGRINIIHIAVLTAVYTLTVLLIMRFEYAYGSKIDWGRQHYAIPDYFRKLFYDTGDIFPSFAANLGAGENIYNFSYYGLYSPVILISYLLPFVKMSVYIQAVSIIGMEISIVLFYRFMRTKFSDNTAFLLSFAFMCAVPLIFHSHRHIMFVSYMPFLILALGSADKYFKKGKKSGLIFWTLMIILSSWFFSVSALAALLVYGAYSYISVSSGSIKLKSLLKAGFGYAGRLFTAVMLAGVVLLPTAAALLSGRDSANVKIDWSEFIPQFKLNYIGMSAYSMGLSCFAVLAVTAALFSRNGARRFLGCVIAAVCVFPAIVYILNGTMYFDAKVLIPFIPLGIILLGDCYEELCAGQKSYRIIFGIFIIVYAAGAVFYDGPEGTWEFMAADMLVLTICIICFKRLGRKVFLWFAAMAVPFTAMLSFNLSDKLVPLKTLQYENSEQFEYLADIIASDEKLVRSSCGVNRSDTVNMVYNIDYYSPYVYSSLHHKGYNSFYFNEIRNENEYRNSALTTRSSNILFDIFMGNKYLITDKDHSETGYEQVCSMGELRLYKNNNALPVGRSTDRVISAADYHQLNSVQRMEALVNCIVTEGEEMQGYKSSAEQYGEILLEESENITALSGGYRIKSSENFKASVKLTEPIPRNKIFIIEIKADNKTGKRNDVKISINGIKNTLTNPEWKYYNKNTFFEYVLTSGNEESLSELEFQFSRGDYTISEINAYTIDYPTPYYDELVFDKNKTKGDVMEGSIDCSSDGYFELTVPYDSGFEIYVDGSRQDYEKVDTAFIGFPISKGSHDIKIVYTAPFQREGIAVSAAGLLICAVFAAYDLKKRKTSKPK